MDTRKLIEKLYKYYEDFVQCKAVSIYEACCDCKKAAHKLEELQRLIDDMFGDHYVDYLDFYANKCRELEEENEDLNKRLDAIRSLIERHVSE